MRSIRAAILTLVTSVGLLLTNAVHAVETQYQYDALGRLIEVTRPDGTVTNYTLDPAGNRTKVEEALGGATSPASINVPAISLTGSYTVTWSGGTGPVTTYELWESTTSNFTVQTRVFSGPGTSASISGHGNGTFYYRVRGCSGSACTPYRTGANGVAVTVPPGTPASITIPASNNTGGYTITWGSATGTMTAYQLLESTSSNFAGEVGVYSGTALTFAVSSKPSGTFYYRVRACNGAACSAPREGGNPIVVTIPPGMPGSISVPGTSSTGAFTVSWGTATGTITAYQLYEANNASFTGETLVNNSTATSFDVSGKGNGTFYYRVRACNAAQCSSHRTGSNGAVVTLPPSAPASLGVPSTNNTGSYTISWGAAAGTLTAYELYEATNASFSGETRVYDSTGTSAALSGRGNGTYYYRLRACNVGSCSGYAPGANSVLVTLPPGAPISITVPGSTAGTSFTVNWGAAASGNVTAYQLYESTSASFSPQTQVYSGGGTSTSLSGRTSNTYYYRVRACNSGECGGYTSGTTGIVVDLIAPSAPGTPSFSIVGTAVTASYGPASDNVGVTAYEYRLNGAASWSAAGSSSTGLSGLTHNTGYTFDVRARDGVGNAGSPSSGSFTTGPPIPGSPTGLAFNQIADCAWSASWSATTHATYYRFADTQASESNVPGTSTTVNCPTGNPQANKPNWIRACNATGCGGQVYFGAPSDITPPTTPGTPQFSSVTSNSATVTWTASFDFSGIANYQYNIGSGWVTIGSVANVALTGLNPTTNYTFQVRAIDAAGLTGSASSASFSTPAAPDVTPPSAPGTITMGTITSTTAPASWVAASDNVGVTGYEYRLNGAATWTNLGLVLSTNIAVTGGTNYTLEVRARDGAGNLGSAASRTFSTPAAIPVKPTGLNRWNPSQGSWYATWGSVSGATFYRFLNNAGNQTDTPSTNIEYQCPWEDCPSNRPKSVRACNGSGCSSEADFAP
jgi:YD repeat-containing protein